MTELTGQTVSGAGGTGPANDEVDAAGFLTGGAYGTGLATVTPDGTVLDVWYPAPTLLTAPNHGEQPELRLPERTDDIRGVRVQVTQTRIASLADAPVNTADTYLRLHLLSARLVRPRSI